MDWEKAKVELSKKLDPSHVRPPSKFGPKGDYIEGWHAIAEANRIFGFGEWSYDVTECRCVSERPRPIGQDKKDGWGVTYTCQVRVIVGGATREDVGAGHGYDVDCGAAHESAIKEAVTDALKRSLRTFGNPFGLALYDKSRENVGVTAEDGEIATAIAQINSVLDMAGLQAFWAGLSRNARHIAEAPEVIAAKDARKTQLSAKDAA